jgi:ComEC/Rec2-related protein
MKRFAAWQKNIAEFRGNCRRLFLLYPALFIAAGVVCGSNWGWLLIPVFPLVWIFFSRREALAFGAAGAAAVLAGMILSHEPDSSYLRKLDGRDSAGEILARVTDTSYGGEKIPWLAPPKFFQAELLAIRLNGESELTPVSGSIMISAADATPFYGDFLRLNGVFRTPRQEVLRRSTVVSPGGAAPPRDTWDTLGFDYSAYLNNRGIAHIFYASDFSEADGRLNWYRQAYRLILRGRESTLAVAASPIRSDADKGMIAALLFGCPQGVDRESRKSFIFTGTIHIFTVSGLHVGIVALLTGLLLRGVPFRTRYLLIPAAVLVYVLATGLNAPSVRAFIMIAVWCACRAFLLKTPGLNLVFAAAALLLLLQPGYLFDMGFQYSFVTVGFLILSSGFTTRINERLLERQRWIPPARLTRRDRLFARCGTKLFAALSGCIVAWLAGSTIALYYQGIYVPFSVAANLLLIPLVWLLYPLTALAPLLPPAAYLTELSLELMRLACDFFYSSFPGTACAKPPLWSIFSFFVALAVLLGVRRKGWIVAASVVMALSIGLWHYMALSQPARVQVLHGGASGVPALVITAPGGDDAVMVNAPSYEAANAAGMLLRARGIERLDKLIFTRGLKAYSGGAEKLFDILTVSEIVTPPSFSRREYLARLLPEFPRKVSALCANPKISAENQRSTIEYSFGSLIIKIEVLSTDYGISRLTLDAAGYPPLHLELTNSSILEINEYEFRP